MQTFGVVEAFDVIVGCPHGLIVCLVVFVMDLFDFEALEEAFHRCVVVTVASAAHALQEFAFSEPFAKCARGEL